MLSFISWQQYGIVILVLTTSYYFYVILKYYQKDITVLLNRQQHTPDLFATQKSSSNDVMGKAQQVTDHSLSDAEELLFSETLPDEPIQQEQSIPLPVAETAHSRNPSDELETEIKSLVAVFKGNTDKESFIRLLHILTDSYKRFEPELDLTATLNWLTEYADEKLAFTLSPEDLQINRS